MTNEEIIARILEIRQITNVCDRAIALKRFDKEYKKTSFYKTTKKPLQMLYYEMVVEDTLSFRSILQNLKQFIDELDSDKLVALFDEVNAKTLDTMKTGIEGLADSDLMALLHGIKH